MRHAIRVALLALLAAAAFALVASTAEAEESPAPGPSPSVTAESGPASEPASDTLKAWARKWHRLHIRNLKRDRRWSRIIGVRPWSFNEWTVSMGVAIDADMWRAYGTHEKRQAYRHARHVRQLKARLAKAKRGVPYKSRRYAKLVSRYFAKYLHRPLGVRELRRLLWVIHYESGGNPRCVYRGHYGLFQLMPGHLRGRPMFKPVSNIATAAMLYARNGRAPWLATWGRACASAAR